MTLTLMGNIYRDRRFYPLMVSQEVERALTKYCADKDVTKGKALNFLIRTALVALGYLSQEQAEHKHAWIGQEGFWQCETCRQVEVRA